MSVNDPISDMLTRIRNAGMARKSETTMPSTKVLVAIANILKEEGYIADFEVIENRPQDHFESCPPLRRRPEAGDSRDQACQQAGSTGLCRQGPDPAGRSGLGIAVVSTPQGVITGYEARRRGIGGEVLCTVF